MIERYLDSNGDQFFRLRRLGGKVSLKVDVSHLEVCPALTGATQVIACTMEGDRYLMFSGGLQDAIKEADCLGRSQGIPVRAPSLAPPRVSVLVRRQVFLTTWVTYAWERREYSSLPQAAVAMKVAKARYSNGNLATPSEGMRRFAFFANPEYDPDQEVVWKNLVERVRTGRLTEHQQYRGRAACPRCMSQHWMTGPHQSQCLTCLHTSDHHANPHTRSNSQSRAVD